MTHRTRFTHSLLRAYLLSEEPALSEQQPRRNMTGAILATVAAGTASGTAATLGSLAVGGTITGVTLAAPVAAAGTAATLGGIAVGTTAAGTVAAGTAAAGTIAAGTVTGATLVSTVIAAASGIPIYGWIVAGVLGAVTIANSGESDAPAVTAPPAPVSIAVKPVYPTQTTTVAAPKPTTYVVENTSQVVASRQTSSAAAAAAIPSADGTSSHLVVNAVRAVAKPEPVADPYGDGLITVAEAKSLQAVTTEVAQKQEALTRLLLKKFHCTAVASKPLGRRYLSAVELYFAEKEGINFMRHSILNAVDFAFRASVDPSLQIHNPSVWLQQCNLNLPANYWRSAQMGSYVTQYYLPINDKLTGKYMVLANFDATGCSDDYPKILIAFHGVRFTVEHSPQDLTTCVGTAHVKLASKVEVPAFRSFPCGLMGHEGFINAAASCYMELKQKINTALQGRNPADVQMIVTGHSMGGAIASIISLILLHDYYNKRQMEQHYDCPSMKKDKHHFKLANLRNNVVLLTMGQPRVWTWHGVNLLRPWEFNPADIGENLFGLITGSNADGYMHMYNNYRIVTAVNGNNSHIVPNNIDIIAQIPMAAAMGFKHTVLEKRVYIKTDKPAMFPHDMMKYYKPYMLNDKSSKITTD